MNPPLFSVVVIARNEEHTLPRLLESLHEFRNRDGEIIIVDTGSKDQTVSVARNYGCHVVEVEDRFVLTLDQDLCETLNREYIVDPKVDGEPDLIKVGDRFFDFAAARNFSTELSGNDMVVMPDCDEVFTYLDIDSINEHILKGIDCFKFRYIVAHENGRPLLQFYRSKFYNRKKLKWVGVVHETLPENNNDIVTVRLDESVILLEHFQNSKTDRSQYLIGLAYDCWKNGNTNDRNSHYLGRELMYKRKYRSAIKELTRHVSMQGWLPEQARSMLFIGDCYNYLGDFEKMMSAYLKSLEMYVSRDPLLAIARYYYYRGDHQRTACFAEAALAISRPKEALYFSLESDYTYFPHELLYWAYWYLGDREKSKMHFQKCLEYYPENEKFLKEKSLFS